MGSLSLLEVWNCRGRRSKPFMLDSCHGESDTPGSIDALVCIIMNDLVSLIGLV